MIDNFREFELGPDPFGRTWQAHFSWLQTGIPSGTPTRST
jgi:hypothetical protein